MKNIKSNPRTIIVLLLFFCATPVAVFVTVHAQQSTTTIQVCYNNTNGQLRRVSSASECKENETPTTLSVASSEVSRGSIMVHGTSAGNVGPVVINFGGGVPEYRLPRDGMIQNMRLRIKSNTYPGPAVVTLFVNGNPTSLSTTIPAGSIANIDLPGTVSVMDGDTISVVMDTSAVTSFGLINISVSYEIL